MADATRYAIGDLADLGGVSRRTVRVLRPAGVAAGSLLVWAAATTTVGKHLDQLLRVKAFRRQGARSTRFDRRSSGRQRLRVPRDDETAERRRAARALPVAPYRAGAGCRTSHCRRRSPAAQPAARTSSHSGVGRISWPPIGKRKKKTAMSNQLLRLWSPDDTSPSRSAYRRVRRCRDLGVFARASR